MSRSKVFVLGLVLLLLLAAPIATAANVHLKGGKNAEPAFYDHGLALEASGELAGLGYENVVITMDAEADVESTCTNQGGHQAPGQNPAPITVSGTATLDPSEFKKNGNTPFAVITEEPDPIIPGAPDCPNPNWTETIEDLLFTSAVITVEQPEGTTVLVVDCSFDPPTSDGRVSKRDVTCSVH
jgi:hypothetical protein